MADGITIFAARKIITMDPSVPEATHVAVRDGLVLEVGSRDDCAAWGAATIDDRFSDGVLVPGFIESHAHVTEGTLWARAEYVGTIDRYDPNGKRRSGIRSMPELIERLQEIEHGMRDPAKPLLGWGIDPSFFTPPTPITRQYLDQVSSVRPIFLLHASAHIACVNSRTLELADYAHIKAEGVVRDAAGQPTGELQELAAMMAALKLVAGELLGDAGMPEQFHNFASVAHARGFTTIVDGGASPVFQPAFVATALAATSDPTFPVRIIVHNNGITVPGLDEILRTSTALRNQGNDKLSFQGTKLVLDGSLQGFTGRLRPPGYLRTGTNGIWNRTPEEVRAIVAGLHAAGEQIAAHCNGDQAAEVFIDAVAAAMNAKPRFDHRHFMIHGQMLDEALLRRMAGLGMAVTLFSNHMYYWADFHRDQTLGPFRARAMNPAATALRLGLTVAGHSDAPISPADALFTMWCAVNRVTSSGRVLGPAECVLPHQALAMMTINAARLLHRDQQIGSVRVGKRADFTVLGDDPTAVEPMAIKDIPIRATVLGGRVFPVAG